MVFGEPLYNSQQRRAILAAFKRCIDNKRKRKRLKKIKTNNLTLKLHCLKLKKKRRKRKIKIKWLVYQMKQ